MSVHRGVGGVVGIPAAWHAGQSRGGDLVPGGSPFFWGAGLQFFRGVVSNFSGGVSNFSGGVRGTPNFGGGEFFFHFFISAFFFGDTLYPPPRSRVKHMVNERPVRILLECILVMTYYYRAGGHGLLVHPFPDPLLPR